MSFDKIENSIFIDFYINEIWAVALSIRALGVRLNGCATFQEMTAKKGNNILSPFVEPHEITYSILGCASRLHKLFESSSQRKGEPADDYAFRKSRSKYLRKLLLPKKKAGHEIFKSGTRNAVENFEERMDLMNRKIIDGDFEINAKSILYNLTLSSEKVFASWDDLIPIKVLIFESGDYYMVDHAFCIKSVNLYEILNEVGHIVDRCSVWGEARSTPKGIILKDLLG